MGLKDTAAKNFFGRAEVLASILDYILYQCRPTVQAGQLCDLCGEHHRVLQNEDGSFRTNNRYRDKLFEYDNGEEVVTVGFEYQAYDDNKMTFRVMDYDHRRYKELDKAGILIRCFIRQSPSWIRPIPSQSPKSRQLQAVRMP